MSEESGTYVRIYESDKTKLNKLREKRAKDLGINKLAWPDFLKWLTTKAGEK